MPCAMLCLLWRYVYMYAYRKAEVSIDMVLVIRAQLLHSDTCMHMLLSGM